MLHQWSRLRRRSLASWSSGIPGAARTSCRGRPERMPWMLASRGQLPGRYLRAGHVLTVLALWTSTPPFRHRTTAVVCGCARDPRPLGSGVHVPVELVRRGPERGLQVLVELQLLVLLEEVLREDRLEEHVVGLQVLDRLLQGSRQLSDAVLLALARAEMIEILVDGVARIDLLLDAVEARAQHCGEGQVRVAGRVRRPIFDPFRGFDALVVHRNPDVRAPVPPGPGNEHGRLVARDEPAVGVRRRVCERTQAAGVLPQPADVVPARLADLQLLVLQV